MPFKMPTEYRVTLRKGMNYTWVDALYDLMSVQVPFGFVVTLLLTAGIVDQVQSTIGGVIGFVSLITFLWFCFVLMSLAADLLVLLPLFWIFRRLYECKWGASPSFIASAKKTIY